MRALTLLCILGVVHGAVRLGTRRTLQLKKTSVKQPVVLSDEVRRSMETAKALGQSVADFKSNYPQAQDASALVPDSGYSSWEKPAPVAEPLPKKAPPKAEAAAKDDVTEMIARAQKAVSQKKRLDAQKNGDVEGAHKLLKTAEQSVETEQSSSDSMSMEEQALMDDASTDEDTTDSVQEKQASDDNTISELPLQTKEVSSDEEQNAAPEEISAPDQQELNEGSGVAHEAAVPEKVVPAVASPDEPAAQQQGLDNFAGPVASTQKLAATISDVSDVVDAAAASSVSTEEAVSKEDTVDSTAAEDQDTTVVSDEVAAGTSEKQGVAVQEKDTGAKTDVDAEEEGTAIDDTNGVDQQSEESAGPIVEGQVAADKTEEVSSNVADKMSARQEDPTVLDWYAQDPNDQSQPVTHEHVAI